MKFFWVTVPKPLEHAVSSCRKHFTSAAIFSALVNVLFLAPTIYMMQIYDRVVPTNGTTSLFWLTVIVGLALVTLAMLDAVRGRLMMRASLRLNQMMAGDVLNRLMARRTVKSGEPTTAQAIREFDTLRQAVGGQAFMALFDIPWTPIYFIVAFLIHPLLGILIFIGAAILLALALINARATRQSNEASIEANASAYSAQEAALSQAEIIRALGMRGAVVRRQLAEREEGLKHSVTSQFSATKYNSIVKFARMFMQSLSLGLGAWLAIQGQISIGAIIAASVLLSRALQPIEVLVRVWPTITQARQAAESLEHLFDSTDDILQETMKMPTPTGRITMNSVSVSNPEGTAKMLDGVTLSMEPGEIVGLIGPSGAGKTTLVRAIVGAVQPEEGEIRIDGVSYLDWEPDQMARHIGYLPQETALLQGTIKENISRFEAYRGGNEEAVDEKVINAAQLAGVHDMILHIPDSYDAKIGNGGAGLSRGQAQRIGLARALYDDPVLLVLDEPSSALDAIGEQALIMATNHAKKRGAAVMIVAHRGTVLKDADRIAVMRNGTIERSGPRDTILEDLKTAAANANVVSMNRKK
ncbi:type I secretion system permease/ATPase [Parasphingorhabdus sp.]|jgi:ATP-binding cassette subfamily C protein|uniref:type I secretion system permease/ATPase n=1 Tax=Parasphingorhabdus sp. TaxID=2709688 RepID=UPI003D2BA305